MVFPSYDSNPILAFVDVRVKLSLDNGETRRTLDPVVGDFTEKTCVVYSAEVLLEDQLVLDLLKPFP